MDAATVKIGMVIVAGGAGLRMGTELPKQFLPLAGRPILVHTVERLLAFVPQTRLIVVLPQAHMAYWKKLCGQYNLADKLITVSGGDTRFLSVKNGLIEAAGCDWIGVHDGVRPLVTKALIERCVDKLRTAEAVIPTIPVVDSMRKTDRKGNHPVDRSHYRLVQTPQFFRADTLLTAYEQDFDPLFTDDASVVESSGIPITLVEGEKENLKITTPLDLQLAELLWRQEKE